MQQQRHETPSPTCTVRENERLYAEWFDVGGDLDDFIFYGEELPAESAK